MGALNTLEDPPLSGQTWSQSSSIIICFPNHPTGFNRLSRISQLRPRFLQGFSNKAGCESWKLKPETTQQWPVRKRQRPAVRRYGHSPRQPWDGPPCGPTPETLERAFERLQGYNRQAMRSLPEAPKMLPVATVFATVATQAAEALR